MPEDEKPKLQDVLDDPDRLWAYLKARGANHNSYKYYSNVDRIGQIIDSESICLSLGDRWNDYDDRKSFATAVKGMIRFGVCFSFSISENVAMWMLYGGVEKKGAMLDLTRKMMKEITSQSEYKLGYLSEKDEFICCKQVTRDDGCELYLADILYCGKAANEGYSVKRSDERVDDRAQEPNDTRLLIKSYPWSYENEVRLILEVPERLVAGNVELARISLKSDKDSLKSRAYLAPNNQTRGLGYNRSKIKGTIDWDLCRHCSLRAAKS